MFISNGNDLPDGSLSGDEPARASADRLLHRML